MNNQCTAGEQDWEENSAAAVPFPWMYVSRTMIR
jgi:hypothetical protein